MQNAEKLYFSKRRHEIEAKHQKEQGTDERAEGDVAKQETAEVVIKIEDEEDKENFSDTIAFKTDEGSPPKRRKVRVKVSRFFCFFYSFQVQPQDHIRHPTKISQLQTDVLSRLIIKTKQNQEHTIVVKHVFNEQNQNQQKVSE